MRIPFEFYELLRSRINIDRVVGSVVKLHRKSSEYSGLCPFHNEKTPSFTVNPLKKFYHCFGCGANGDVIKFVSSMNAISYKEAAIKLAHENGIALPIMSEKAQKNYDMSKEAIEILELASNFFISSMTEEVRTYLATRGVTNQAIKDFGLGYAPRNNSLQQFFERKTIPLMMLERVGLIVKKEDGHIYSFFRNRIMFPIKDIYNRVIGFGGRSLDDSLPKYLNSHETIVFKKSEVLYGENTALQAIRKKKYVVIVEGYMDVIALNIAGFHEVVATLGTAVTESHIHKLWNMSDEIVVCLDGDNAGQKAAQKFINLVLSTVTHSKVVSFVELPFGLDPDDVVQTKGSGFLEQLIVERKNLSEMIWDIEYGIGDFRTPEAKAGLEVRLENYVTKIQDATLKRNYQRFFKEQVWSNLIKLQNKKNSNHKKSKTSNICNTSSIVVDKISEKELLEYAICTALVRFPETVLDEAIRDLLFNVKFSVLSLQYFIEWLFTEVVDIANLEVEEQIKSTDFYETYLLLKNENNTFLSVVEFRNDKQIDHLLLIKILYKKHQLSLLKDEYVAVVQKDSDDKLIKAKLYQTEIMRVTAELEEIADSFLNN